MRTIAVLVVALALAACNTVGGVGQDLEAAGRAVSDTANDVRN
jgi:entericidin B